MPSEDAGQLLFETFVCLAIATGVIIVIICGFAAAHLVPKFDSECCTGKPKTILHFSELRTGDVLTVAYSDVRQVFIRIFGHSIWTHVGVIWQNPATGELFVVEAGAYRAPHHGKIVRIPLWQWLNINKGAAKIALSRLSSTKLELELQTKISESLSQLEALDIGVESFRIDWVRFWQTKKRHQHDKSCSEKGEAAPVVKWWKQNQLFTDLYHFNHCGGKPVKRSLEKRSLPGLCVVRSPLEKLGLYNPSEEKGYSYLVTCTEVAVFLLQECGVLSNETTPCSFLPNAFVTNKIKCSEDGASTYLPPVLLDLGNIRDEIRADNSGHCGGGG